MKFILYILFFIITGPLISSDSVWQRNIINYERNTYMAGSQNWSVKQSPNNRKIYFANTSGLLEFDGIFWSLYPIRNKLVRALQIDKDRIYVGGSSEIGYFEPDNSGKLIYHSLTNLAPEWRGEVWNIFVRGDKVYFLDEGQVVIYDGKDKMKVISTGVKVDCASLINNYIYIGSPDGVFFINYQDKLTPLLDTENIKGEKIVSILSFDNKLLTVTARKGIYLLGSNKRTKMTLPASQNFIENNQLFCASLEGSLLSLGSVQNGVLVTDLLNPQYQEEFNLNNGLYNNTILSSLFDLDGNLWIGLDRGIAYINIESSIRPMFSVSSPIGTGYCSAYYKGDLYLGTNQGLYKVDKSGAYTLVKDTEGQIWSLSVYNETLFCAGDTKISIIENQSIYNIPLTGIWQVKPLKDKMIASSYSGLKVLVKKQGKWQYSHNIPDFYNSCRDFYEEDQKTIWVMGNDNIVLRLTLNDDLTQVIAKKEYILQSPLNPENPFFNKIDNTLFICTRNEILKYVKMSDKFIPFSELENLLEGPQKYNYLSIDPYKNIWFVTDNNLKFLRYNNGYSKKKQALGLSNELINGYQNVMLKDSVSAILGVDRGFVMINLSDKQTKTTPLTASIRKIIATDNDSTLFYEKSKQFLKIPYSLNSINIYFSTTEYADRDEIVYSVRLHNIDEKWSTPSEKNNKEYTKLPEGMYTFEVKAMKKGETDSDKITYLSFRVLPPWYRSVWAYIAYLTLILTCIFIFYRRTIWRQKRIIDQKGKELIAQKQRHQEKKQLKDKEIYELQNENLKSNLEYKTQELSGYILNLARKNEMLENVKKGVFTISKAIDDNKPSITIKQKVMSLISQINHNIEHDKDFDVFQSNFNVLHSDFFNALEKRYSNLTRNEKVLCAYLKMNLSSKEIASLLNITIRGVEVSRYRLRKKLEIDKDINLNDFMNSLK